MRTDRYERWGGAGRGLWLAVALWLCGAWPACSPKKTPVPQGAPPEVLVMQVAPREVPIFNEYVGALEGSVSAAIQAQVSGYLISQKYKEGSLVKKGDLLFEIDPRPFEATLAKARAALSEAEAAQRQAGLNAQRSLDLFARGVTSTQERDNAVQTNLARAAQVESQRAQIKQAQLDLEYTRISAPIEGVAGIAQVQVGNLVGPSTGPLTTISTVDPIKAFFAVSEQRYSEYMKRWSDPTARAEHEKALQLQLLLADGTVYPHTGELFAVDRQVDPRTGALRIAGIFPNPDRLLKPGQFARVRVQTEVRKGALLVPQRAVTEIQGLYQVFVVGADNRVGVRPVKVGARIDSNWLIEHGLAPGETVVVEGVAKVRDGMPVVPKPWTPPAQEKPGAGPGNAPPGEDG